MLQQPTKEKLYALRLHGMIEGIEQREIAQQQLIAQHPELLTKGGHGKPH